MKTQDKELSHLIEDEIVEAIQGTLELVGAVVNAVSDVVTRAMETSARESLSEVVKGALAGVAALVGDSRLVAEGMKVNTGLAVKGIMIGVIRGNAKNSDEILSMIDDVAELIISEVIATGREDIKDAAKSAVDGAVEGAQSIGSNIQEAALAAAAGALKGARGADPATRLQVNQAVTPVTSKF